MTEQTNLAPYLDDYFKVRFPFDPRRDVVWREVCRYLQAKHFPTAERILDLGAGYCNFINNVTGTSKLAPDPHERHVLHLNEDSFSHDRFCVARTTDGGQTWQTESFAQASYISFEALHFLEVGHTLLD